MKKHKKSHQKQLKRPGRFSDGGSSAFEDPGIICKIRKGIAEARIGRVVKVKAIGEFLKKL
jgi:hypothetical protein